MIPSHELRLQSMLRAMTEVIIPALDREQQLAIDQANILVGNLRLLLEQADKVYQYRYVELREYVALVRRLLDVQAGTADAALLAAALAALAAAEPVAALPVPTQTELVAMVQGLKSTADALLKTVLASGDPGVRAAASRLVFEQGQRAVLRERVWFRQAGFELDAGALPSLADVLPGK